MSNTYISYLNLAHHVQDFMWDEAWFQDSFVSSRARTINLLPMIIKYILEKDYPFRNAAIFSLVLNKTKE